jgi:hypothetical protein
VSESFPALRGTFTEYWTTVDPWGGITGRSGRNSIQRAFDRAIRPGSPYSDAPLHEKL